MPFGRDLELISTCGRSASPAVFASFARMGSSQRRQASIHPPEPRLDQCTAFVGDITGSHQRQRARFGLQKMLFRLRVKRIVSVQKRIEPAGIHEDSPHRITSAQARSWGFKSSPERDEYFPAKRFEGNRHAFISLGEAEMTERAWLQDEAEIKDTGCPSCVACDQFLLNFLA